MGVLLWILMICFVAGIAARLIVPGPNKPNGFALRRIRRHIPRAGVGFYRDQGAGFTGGQCRRRRSLVHLEPACEDRDHP
jgi:hypothetical protein